VSTGGGANLRMIFAYATRDRHDGVQAIVARFGAGQPTAVALRAAVFGIPFHRAVINIRPLIVGATRSCDAVTDSATVLTARCDRG
jgi:hypothetical protein